MDSPQHSDKPQKPTPGECKARNWAEQIMEKPKHEDRSQPWKKEFGTPTATDSNAEDWIPFPAMYDVSKKGIAGWLEVWEGTLWGISLIVIVRILWPLGRSFSVSHSILLFTRYVITIVFVREAK